MKDLRLKNEYIKSLVKLINNEIEQNESVGDDAYNTYWENIKMALGYAIVR